MNIPRHIPVFVDQIATLLQLKPNQLMVDCTLGDGGHTQEALVAGCKVISFDVDTNSINRAINFLSPKYSPIIVTKDQFGKIPSNFQWLIVNDNFGQISELITQSNIGQIDALIADLGTSQYQVAAPERGFSFLFDGPLDMRLDSRLGVTAADLLNVLPAKQIADLLFSVEESFGSAISRAIVSARAASPITTTSQLSQIISRVKPKMGKTHPATKTFMALRMAVNMELDVLSKLLNSLPKVMKSSGLAGIISFHSGEDRLVKQNFKRQEEEGLIRVINSKPIEPDQNEINNNHKIRSAKLRLIQIN